MASYIGTLKDKDENFVIPRTTTDAITTPSGESLSAVVGASFTTATRPVNKAVGYTGFDITLNKPIWLKIAPSTWVDALGTVV